MTDLSSIFLAGASRGVGREIASYLSAQPVPVTALLRTEAACSELALLGISTVLGDAMNTSDIERAMSTEHPFNVVISTIGGLPQQTERPDYWAHKNLIDRAVQVGVQRFILVSSIGTGESAIALPPQAMEALREVLLEKDKAEQYLIASGLAYTIIRPGGLKSEPATGNGILTEDFRISGTIHRADVAQLVCRCLNSDRANYKILSAVDRKMMYGQPTVEEFQLD